MTNGQVKIGNSKQSDFLKDNCYRLHPVIKSKLRSSTLQPHYLLCSALNGNIMSIPTCFIDDVMSAEVPFYLMHLLYILMYLFESLIAFNLDAEWRMHYFFSNHVLQPVFQDPVWSSGNCTLN